VHTYTHYPTISTDMLQVVYERRPGHNHDALIASSRARNAVKLVYYLLFSIAYGIVGSFADFVMVNS
jgi:alpha-1,2-mannosyltransferase